MRELKLPDVSYVIMRSFVGENANSEIRTIVEPVFVYTNEEKAMKKLKELLRNRARTLSNQEDQYWVWSTPRGA